MYPFMMIYIFKWSWNMFLWLQSNTHGHGPWELLQQLLPTGLIQPWRSFLQLVYALIVQLFSLFSTWTSIASQSSCNRNHLYTVYQYTIQYVYIYIFVYYIYSIFFFILHSSMVVTIFWLKFWYLSAEALPTPTKAWARCGNSAAQLPLHRWWAKDRLAGNRPRPQRTWIHRQLKLMKRFWSWVEKQARVVKLYDIIELLWRHCWFH